MQKHRRGYETNEFGYMKSSIYIEDLQLTIPVFGYIFIKT